MCCNILEAKFGSLTCNVIFLYTSILDMILRPCFSEKQIKCLYQDVKHYSSISDMDSPV